jgi:hypothetical protein
LQKASLSGPYQYIEVWASAVKEYSRNLMFKTAACQTANGEPGCLKENETTHVDHIIRAYCLGLRRLPAQQSGSFITILHQPPGIVTGISPFIFN